MNVAHSYFKKIMCFEAITIFWNSWKAGMYANATSCGIFLLSFFLCMETNVDIRDFRRVCPQCSAEVNCILNAGIVINRQFTR